MKINYGGEELINMSEYKFYGWKTATMRDKNNLTPRNYYDILSEIWCADTCAPRMRDKWSSENKTLGQCSVTAFLIKEFFGGKVYGILRSGGNYHCFNIVDGCVFDLTSEQFGNEILDYNNCTEQFSSVHFAKEEKYLRYEYLKAKVEARVAEILNSNT